MRRVCLLSVVLGLLVAGRAAAATYSVKTSGGDYASIQACANAAQPGDTCVVYAGSWESERVSSVRSGTSEAARITFRANTGDTITMQGFLIDHAYITVEGFDITGYTTGNRGLVEIRSGGNYTHVLNNTIRDGASDVYGIYFYQSGGDTADRCVIRGNTLSNLLDTFLYLNGESNIVETNTLEYQSSSDYLRLWGSGSVIRRNVFWRGTERSGAGHPDWSQTWGASTLESHDHLIEENLMSDLWAQLTQYNSGSGDTSEGVLYDNVRDITFRRNIVVNILANGNWGLPGMRLENNTFFLCAFDASGHGFASSLTRSQSDHGMVVNNVFLGCGTSAYTTNGTNGFYSFAGTSLTTEAIGIHVTNDPDEELAITHGFFYDLLNYGGYVNGNAILQPAAFLVEDIDDFVFGEAPDKVWMRDRWKGDGSTQSWVLSETPTATIASITVGGVAKSVYPYPNEGVEWTFNSATDTLAQNEGYSPPTSSQYVVVYYKTNVGAEAYGTYKAAMYDELAAGVAQENAWQASFVADYNFVSGAPGASYPAKATSGCDYDAPITAFRFCEAHGINGGDPELQAGATLTSGALGIRMLEDASWTTATNTLVKAGAFASYTKATGDAVWITSSTSPAMMGMYLVASKTDNDTIVLGDLVSGDGISANRTDVTLYPYAPTAVILGADGLPFTADDGLKPSASGIYKRLCGAGQGGVDIGAYSCAAGTVFSGAFAPPTNPIVREP